MGRESSLTGDKMLFSPKPWKKSERRKYIRTNVLFPVKYAVIPRVLKDENINLKFLAICRSISGGGILLEVGELKEEMLLCNNLLKLEVKLLKNEEPVYVFARLVKAERSFTHSYYLRLCFVHINEGDRERIIKFTKKQRELKKN